MKNLYFVKYHNFGVDKYLHGTALLKYVDTFDGNYDGFYADELFSERSSRIEAEFSFASRRSLNSFVLNRKYINFIFNDYKIPTKYDSSVEYDVLQEVMPASFEKGYSNERLSSIYSIHIDDVDNFKKFVEDHKDDSRIFILSYSVTETKKSKASVFGDEKLTSGNEFLDIFLPNELCYSCDGQFVETALIDDFDVIQLGLGADETSYSVRPVSMEPSDSLPNIGEYEKPNIPDINPTDEIQEWLEKALGVLKVILLVIVFIIGSIVLVLTGIILLPIIIVPIVKRKRRKKNEKKNI